MVNNGKEEDTKNNWYYFENVIEINDIEDDEEKEEEKKETKGSNGTKDIGNEKNMNERSMVNTIVEICHEMTSPIKPIEQVARKQVIENENGNENKKRNRANQRKRTIYNEFDSVIEENTTKGKKNEKEAKMKKRDIQKNEDKKREGNQMKMKTSKRIRR